VSKARAKIGDLVEVVKTWSPERQAPSDTFTYVDLSAVDQEEKRIIGPRQIACAEAPSRARQLVKAGDVLVSTVRPNLNAVALVPAALHGATASTGFCVLRPRRESIDSGYLFHWVRSPRFVSEMVRRATGASYPAVSDRIVCDSEIPLPPLPEQRRIADILDKADALRAKRHAALAQLDTLTQSLFLDMFGDPIANRRQLPVRTLIDLVDEARPISYGILMPGPDQTTGVKYVRVVDMQDGGIKLSGIRKTTEAISNSFRRSLRRPGDLLMSIRGHVGRFAVVPLDLAGANITQDTARLAIAGADPVFVRECLRTESFQRWMARRTKGVAVRGINLEDVKLMPVIIPDPTDQNEFARVAERIGQVRASERASAVELDTLFASLQHRAFRGEL
jgi:type I restriction enzyme, S subunit